MDKLQFLYNEQRRNPDNILYNVNEENKAKFETFVLEKIGDKLPFVLSNGGVFSGEIRNGGKEFTGAITGSDLKGAKTIIDTLFDEGFNNRFIMTFE